MTSQNENNLDSKLSRLLNETSKVLKDGPENEKLTAAFLTLVGIKEFLNTIQPEVNTMAISFMLEDIAEIYAGSKPKIFTSETSEKKGRRKSIPKNTYKALLVAGIDLLVDGGIKPGAAIEIAAKIVKQKPERLRSIRKDLKSNANGKDFSNLMYDFKHYGLSNDEPEEAGHKLLHIAKNYL